ncbi:MAG: cyclic nucleotide-binding domain-containing protein [Pseudobdellovibrionaceae bacterium]|nr:cyclic nucleotide-binding domain-containing protein [Bdellovibrionales bacterium]USN48453.1 MAG: cyclic nucleotide-binding domain-containing protein [Pseudobdellovibrionaceae bacterium]
MSDSIKVFKKGDILFKEGDVLDKVYFIQSGRITLLIERGGKNIELDQVANSQILGEAAVFGNAKMPFTAVVSTEAKTLEIPVAVLKAQAHKIPAAIKLLSKAMSDEIRRGRNTIRSFKMDQDPRPCPQRFIPRLFATLNLVAHRMGKSPEVEKPKGFTPGKPKEESNIDTSRFTENDIIVGWNSLKIYTSRMFLESHQRMENVLMILSKLGYLTLKHEKLEEDLEEEITEIRIHNMEIIELFGEFYQHNLFKAGRAEVIYVDPLAVQVAAAFVELSDGAEPDRNGAVELEYTKLLSDLKEEYAIEIKDTHLNVLEKKGLFIKRKSREEGVFMSFDREEFQRLHSYWQIIYEIDKWNDKGFIDMKEDVTLRKVKKKPKCLECNSPFEAGQNFCGNCGAKLPEITEEAA